MSTHEDYKRQLTVKSSSNRAFGIVFAIFLALVGLGPLRSRHAIRWWALALGSLVLAIALLRPAWLTPFNRAWTKLGSLLSRVVSPVVMALLFFLVVTPCGILIRLLGKDPMRLAPAKSYWIERRPPGPAPDTMAHQF